MYMRPVASSPWSSTVAFRIVNSKNVNEAMAGSMNATSAPGPSRAKGSRVRVSMWTTASGSNRPRTASQSRRVTASA